MTAERQADVLRQESSVTPAADERRDAVNDVPSRANDPVSNATIAQLLGGGDRGESLPGPLRAQLEHALGTNLADVSIHNEPAAQSAAAAVDAQAFTHGRDIYLGPAAPGLDTPAGEALLAHEVMHAEQQRHASAVEPRVSTAGEAGEVEAQRAAGHALAGQPAAISRGASVAGVQRQPAGKPELSITKTLILGRADAERVLLGFLQRASSAAPDGDLRKSSVVRTALMTLSQKGGGNAFYVNVDKFLQDVPNDAAEIARRFVAKLPETIDGAVLDEVNKLVSKDPPPGTASRVGTMVKRTGVGDPDTSRVPPGQSDPAKEADRAVEFSQRMGGQPDPKTVGPVSIDLFRAARILGGLGGAVRGKPQKTPAPVPQESKSVDAAVAQIKADALTPPEIRGSAQAEEFDIAQHFAREVASQIDIALQRKRDTVSLRLGDNFATVKDRAALIAAVEDIIATIRAAFPDKAAPVVNVDVKIGDKWLTRGRVR